MNNACRKIEDVAGVDVGGHESFVTQTRSALDIENYIPVSLVVDGGADGHGKNATQVVFAKRPKKSRGPLPCASAGEDQAIERESPIDAVPDLSQTVYELKRLQRFRIWSIKQQMRSSNALGALVRADLGWNMQLPDDEREKIRKAADKLIKSALKGEKDKGGLWQLVADSAAGSDHIDRSRAGWELRMIKLAKSLPAYQWVKGVRGFGAKGLAMIIGEAGDLSLYNNPAKLWKRLGLGMVGDKRQGAPGVGATAEDWIAHGYNKARRSQVWQLGDSMLKSVIRKVLDDNGEDTGQRMALSYYGQVYLDRKAYEIARSPEMSKMQIHRRAQRYMEKRLLKHLWQEWRGANKGEQPIFPMPLSEETGNA